MEQMSFRPKLKQFVFCDLGLLCFQLSRYCDATQSQFLDVLT